jgi:hypothetical protein
MTPSVFCCLPQPCPFLESVYSQPCGKKMFHSRVQFKGLEQVSEGLRSTNVSAITEATRDQSMLFKQIACSGQNIGRHHSVSTL